MNSFEVFGQTKLLQAEAARILSAQLARAIAGAFGFVRLRLRRFQAHGAATRFPRS